MQPGHRLVLEAAAERQKLGKKITGAALAFDTRKDRSTVGRYICDLVNLGLLKRTVAGEYEVTVPKNCRPPEPKPGAELADASLIRPISKARLMGRRA